MKIGNCAASHSAKSFWTPPGQKVIPFDANNPADQRVVKAEFQGTNLDMYRLEAIIATGKGD